MNVREIDAVEVRSAEAAADPMFMRRWSPRAFSEEPVSDEQLMILFEAARWAPSCFNAQPWRFIYVRPEDDRWQPMLETLTPGNQSWAGKAAVLVTVISRNLFEHNGKDGLTNNFDAGAAWMSLALQAKADGLVTHGMRGFDLNAVRRLYGVPEVFDIDAVIAIGHPGELESLPETYQGRESPSSRKSLSEIVMHGGFTGPEGGSS